MKQRTVEWYNGEYASLLAANKSWGSQEMYRRKLDCILWCIDVSGINKTSKVLDLGCGEGEFIKLLSASGFTEVDGLDISDVAINKAKEKCCGELMIQDFTEPCLLPKKYDCIYDTDCFHMVVNKADRQTFLNNVRANLEPEGVFLTGINASKKANDPIVMVEDHAQYYWPAEEEFIQEVTDAGFILVSQRSLGPRNQSRCDSWVEMIFK